MTATYTPTPLHHDAVGPMCGRLAQQLTWAINGYHVLGANHLDFLDRWPEELTKEDDPNKREDYTPRVVEPDNDGLEGCMADYYQKHADGWFIFPVKYRNRVFGWVSPDKQAAMQVQVLHRLDEAAAARFKHQGGGH